MRCAGSKLARTAVSCHAACLYAHRHAHGELASVGAAAGVQWHTAFDIRAPLAEVFTWALAAWEGREVVFSRLPLLALA